MTNAVIYCRVSTATQEDGSSLESQELACRDHAVKLGFSASRTVSEVYSGADFFDRPLLNQMRDEIRAGMYNAVIVYHTDRLTRGGIAHLAILVEEFERYGAKLISVTQPLDSTDEGELISLVNAYAAKKERMQIKERTMRGRRTKALNGTLSYKKPLFGYLLDSEGRRVPCPVNCGIVQGMFDSILRGDSLSAIAAELNGRGVLTPRGSIWWGSSVLQILKNECYTGRTTVFTQSRSHRFEHGRKVLTFERKPDNSHIELVGVTPQIIDRGVFDRVHAQIKASGKERRGDPQHEFLLRGILKCGDCGRNMSPMISRGCRRYTCSSRANAATKCFIKSIKADTVESVVWAEIQRVINDPDRLRRYAEDQQHYASTEHVTGSTKKKIAQVQKEIDNIIQRSGAFDGELWEKFAAQLKVKQCELQRLTALHAGVKPPSAIADLSEFEQYRSQLVKHLESIGFADRVAVLKRLGLNVTWSGTSLKAYVYCSIHRHRHSNVTAINLQTEWVKR